MATDSDPTTHGFEPYLWDQTRCGYVDMDDWMCGYSAEEHKQPRHAIRCRCSPECRAANKAYHIRKKQEKHTHTAQHGLPADVEHGASAYTNWGCHCDICTTANAAISAIRMQQWRSQKNSRIRVA